ncbi:unnamed protein product [Musa acuminata var. zebrina]
MPKRMEKSRSDGAYVFTCGSKYTLPISDTFTYHRNTCVEFCGLHVLCGIDLYLLYLSR